MTSLEQVLLSLRDVHVIAPAIPYSSYVSIDLSSTNQNLSSVSLTNSTDFESYIGSYLKQHQALVAFGGYIETRNLYKRSTVFNDHSQEERNIHIGLDLWSDAETPVLAALDGTIHSFQYNNHLGDYGPTIIIEHEIDQQRFYTLYGHLSLESLQKLSKGQKVRKGETIATLGNASVNGDYAPHLHFQIIKDLQGKTGDYPGVCSQSTLPFYVANCPDPNLLLKIHS